MNESKHNNTPNPYQPLLSAPVELLSHGLRDAHHYPLVGERTAGGDVRSWRTLPAKAWEHPLVEWPRTANSYCSVVLDCDSRESQELALDVVEVGSLDLPRPNVAALRSASGHLQLGWNLRTPVHRGETARLRPLAAFKRITEYYTAKLRADWRYVGVLSYNPVHSDYQTIYPHSEPYDLAELAEPIPGNWRTPARAVELETESERNWGMFGALLRYAGSSSHSEADIRYEAERLYARNDNYHPHYFSRAELNGVVQSVLRKRSRWGHRPSGWHSPKWLRKQAAVGRRGGLVSKGGGRPRKWTSEAERLKAFRASHRTETSLHR